MENKKDAIRAMNALSNTEVDGRALMVNEARPKTNRF
jgi:RNA recognition motif-containing protein